MKQLSQELKERDLIFQNTGESLETITDTESRTLYLGIDPTADSLHVGHLAPLLLARRFKNYGHTVVILVGGGTGRIGDPSGKNEERTLLSDDEIKKNTEHLIAQIQRIFAEHQFTVVNNDAWLGSAGLIPFLRDIGKHFTVNSMLQKEMVKKRIEDPEQSISFTEFTYSLLQAYDYLHLHESNGCTLQIGGSDQWGNIIPGIELVKKKTGDEVYGLTTKLVINKSTGKKFGKTESGAVWLDALRTTPFKFYQFWLNTEDESVIDFIKAYTFLSIESIEELTENVKANPQERKAQKILAQEVTRMVHGKEAVLSAERVSQVLFGNDSVSNLSQSEKEMLIVNSPSFSLSTDVLAAGFSVTELLVKTELASSKRDARQLVTEGAVSINAEKISDPDTLVSKDNFINGIFFLRKGKKDTSVVYLEQ